MIKLKDILLEETGGSAEDFAKRIEDVMKKQFPNSTIYAKYSSNLSEAIDIRFAIGQKKDWSGGYAENAPVDYRAMVFGIRNGMTNDKMVLESNGGASVLTKPIDKPHYAYGRVRVPTRKTKGNEERILKAIEKVMVNLKKATKDNLNIMTDDHQWVKKYI